MSPQHPLRRTLVISDNPEIMNALRAHVEASGLGDNVILGRSPKSHHDLETDSGCRVVCMKVDVPRILEEFQFVVSAHCRQIFPRTLHDEVECINVHPGFNPEGRGWFPQVWSIVHGLPLGFTVHRIDEQLDHGAILHREQIPLYAWDTSLTAYRRVLEREISWLQENFTRLLAGDYEVRPMEHGGRLFLRKDFEQLCELDLGAVGPAGDFLNRLRALSFPGYRNAWFRDSVTGKRVFVRLELEAED